MSNYRVYASCHNHSTYSDGEYTPELLVRIAKNLGHEAIILTDHDTIAGYPFIKAAAEAAGMKTMLGCEFSTYHKTKDGKEVGVHLLGFDFDPENEEVQKIIAYGSSVQTGRSRVLFDLGVKRGTIREGCTWEDVLADHPYHNYICNNEVFASMLKRDIYKYSEYDDFLKANFSYNLGLEDEVRRITGKDYHDIRTADVVKAVLNAGGVPVVAHPAGLSKYADEFVEMGARGFETRCSSLKPAEHEFFEKYCLERGLYRMGGADHESVLGGLLSFGEEYNCPYEMSGIDKDRFFDIYERRLG